MILRDQSRGSVGKEQRRYETRGSTESEQFVGLFIEARTEAQLLVQPASEWPDALKLQQIYRHPVAIP